jgi:hypothetical protein
MALDDVLVGEICHIKGKKRGAARYDEAQTTAELNDYTNLILLCATHHKVVDDDEEAYSVERLIRMKISHEASSTSISDKDSTQVANSYHQFINTDQLLGIAANSFTASTVTVNAGMASNPISTRQLQAAENLWADIRTLQKEFGSLIFVDTILVPDEMDEFFKFGKHWQLMEVVNNYSDPKYVAKKIVAVDPDKERPFVNNNTWATVFTIRALFGRSAFLIQNSFLERRYKDWRSDHGMDQILRARIPETIVEEIKQKRIGGLQAAISYLESRFLAEAGLQK